MAVACMAIAAATLDACAVRTGTPRHGDQRAQAQQTRLELRRRSQVWVATDVASMDLRAGPQEPGAFASGQTVTCDYLDKKMTGRSPKFTCAIGPHDDVKVKYGRDNGEV
jgi:hypothetical protein